MSPPDPRGLGPTDPRLPPVSPRTTPKPAALDTIESAPPMRSASELWPKPAPIRLAPEKRASVQLHTFACAPRQVIESSPFRIDAPTGPTDVTASGIDFPIPTLRRSHRTTSPDDLANRAGASSSSEVVADTGEPVSPRRRRSAKKNVFKRPTRSRDVTIARLHGFCGQTRARRPTMGRIPSLVTKPRTDLNPNRNARPETMSPPLRTASTTPASETRSSDPAPPRTDRNPSTATSRLPTWLRSEPRSCRAHLHNED